MKKEIIALLAEDNLIVSFIQVRGFNKEEKSIKKLTISLDNYDDGDNVIYKVKSAIDTVEEKHGIYTRERLFDF